MSADTPNVLCDDYGRPGQLSRRADGTWLLTGEPVSAPPEGAAEVIRQRRRLMPSPPVEFRVSLHE